MRATSNGAVRDRLVARGFTLVEVAVVLLIVGLILGSMMFTLSAQVDQSNRTETLRRLESAKELLLAFAIVNGRLPCPAICTDFPFCLAGAGGVEAGAAGACTNSYGGFLPAVTIGYQQVDARGYAVDAWGNRVRYAVASTVTACTGSSTLPHFTHAVNLKTNGISCVPGDLIVCSEAQAGATCAAGNPVTNQNTVAAIVFSTGKNGAFLPQSANELENYFLDGDAVFVSRLPDPADAIGGEFDDLLAWIPVGLLYGRLISAGVLP